MTLQMTFNQLRKLISSNLCAKTRQNTIFKYKLSVYTSELNITGRLPSVKPVIRDLKPNFA